MVETPSFDRDASRWLAKLVVPMIAIFFDAISLNKEKVYSMLLF